uniref:Endo/exonuclease/phosphatase domain-containing protein n=1 Tax=Haemonchus contortus TaxID=6289 RepID=A0A7I4XSK8_HAECO
MTSGERRRNLGLGGKSWVSDHDSTFSTQHRDCFPLYVYNARAVPSNAALHELLDATEHIKYDVIALQETKSRRTDVRRMNDGTPITCGKTIFIVDYYSPHSTADKVELDAFYDQLKEVIHNERSFNEIVGGDFKAWLGEAREEEFRFGKFRKGDRNENGNRLADSCLRLESSMEILSSRRRNIAAEQTNSC